MQKWWEQRGCIVQVLFLSSGCRSTGIVSDVLDNMLVVTDGAGYVTSSGYEADGHLISTADGLGATTQYGYDVLGHQVAISDANGRTSSKRYDLDGRLLASSDPLRRQTSYGYAAAVLADTPVAFWPLSERSGGVAHDATGHGHDGQIGNGVSLGQTGPPIGDGSTAMSFNGSSTGRIAVGKMSNLPSGSQPYSLEAWVDVVSGGANAQGFVGYGLDRPSELTDPSGQIPQFDFNCDMGGKASRIDTLFDPHDFAESFYLWHYHYVDEGGACEVWIPRAAWNYYKNYGHLKRKLNIRAAGRADVVDDINGNWADLWEFAPVKDLLNLKKRDEEHAQAAFYAWRASVCPRGLPPWEEEQTYGAYGYTLGITYWKGPRQFYIDSYVGGVGLVSPPVWFPAEVGWQQSYVYVVVLVPGGLPGLIGFKYYRLKLTQEEQKYYERNAAIYAKIPATYYVPTPEQLAQYWDPYLGGKIWGQAPKQWPAQDLPSGAVVNARATAGGASQQGGSVGNSTVAAGGGVVGAVLAGIGAIAYFIKDVVDVLDTGA